MYVNILQNAGEFYTNPTYIPIASKQNFN